MMGGDELCRLRRGVVQVHSIRIVAVSLAALRLVSTEVQAAGRSAGTTADCAGAILSAAGWSSLKVCAPAP
jgi:hypothetical protein